MPKNKTSLSDEHARELEQSQDALRTSIAETQRLMDKSDEMIARHRRERERDKSDD